MSSINPTSTHRQDSPTPHSPISSAQRETITQTAPQQTDPQTPLQQTDTQTHPQQTATQSIPSNRSPQSTPPPLPNFPAGASPLIKRALEQGNSIDKLFLLTP